MSAMAGEPATTGDEPAREPEHLSDDDVSDEENAYDILESELCGEYSHAPGLSPDGNQTARCLQDAVSLCAAWNGRAPEHLSGSRAKFEVPSARLPRRLRRAGPVDVATDAERRGTRAARRAPRRAPEGQRGPRDERAGVGPADAPHPAQAAAAGRATEARRLPLDGQGGERLLRRRGRRDRRSERGRGRRPGARGEGPATERESCPFGPGFAMYFKRTAQAVQRCKVNQRKEGSYGRDRAAAEAALARPRSGGRPQNRSGARTIKVGRPRSDGRDRTAEIARPRSHGQDRTAEIARPRSGGRPQVYKTSILVFRDRQRYVDGEHRFKRGYTSGRNPRKMVQLWAEKELRNYKRLQRAGVPVFAPGGTLGAFKDARRRKLSARFELRPQAPRPALLKGHVLAMDFVGSNGWPAPRLHEAELDEERLREARVRRADRSLIDARGYDVDGPWRDESRRTPAATTWMVRGETSRGERPRLRRGYFAETSRGERPRLRRGRSVVRRVAANARGYDVDGPWRDESRRTLAATTRTVRGDESRRTPAATTRTVRGETSRGERPRLRRGYSAECGSSVETRSPRRRCSPRNIHVAPRGGAAMHQRNRPALSSGTGRRAARRARCTGAATSSTAT